MPDNFFLRLGHQPQQGVSWLCAGETALRSCHGSLQEAAAAAVGSKVVILAPASEVICARAELPALQGNRLRQALPYALEEQFATEVEGLHLAHARRDEQGRVPVLALAREQMQAWQALLQAVELNPARMLNEACLLPLSEGKWSLLLEDNEALLRRGPHDGQSLPLTQLDSWLKLAWAERESSIVGLQVYDARSDAAELPFTPPVDMALEQQPCRDPLALLSRGESDVAINLLCGEFSRREQLGRVWRPWRGVAAMLLAWLLLQTGMGVSDYYSLKAEDERLYLAIEEIYREAFPEARNIVNPQVQMERQLASLRGGGMHSPFITLLADSAPLLKGQSGVQLRNLRYRQDELELELELNSLATLDALKGALEQAGLRVEIRTATSRDERVEARLAIRRGSV